MIRMFFVFKHIRQLCKRVPNQNFKKSEFYFRKSGKRRDFCTLEIKLREWSQMRNLEEILNNLVLLIERNLSKEFSLRLSSK